MHWFYNVFLVYERRVLFLFCDIVVEDVFLVRFLLCRLVPCHFS